MELCKLNKKSMKTMEFIDEGFKTLLIEVSNRSKFYFEIDSVDCRQDITLKKLVYHKRGENIKDYVTLDTLSIWIVNNSVTSQRYEDYQLLYKEILVVANERELNIQWGGNDTDINNFMQFRML